MIDRCFSRPIAMCLLACLIFWTSTARAQLPWMNQPPAAIPPPMPPTALPPSTTPITTPIMTLAPTPPPTTPPPPTSPAATRPTKTSVPGIAPIGFGAPTIPVSMRTEVTDALEASRRPLPSPVFETPTGQTPHIWQAEGMIKKPPEGMRRSGFFQSASLRSSYLPAMGDAPFGLTSVETWLKLAIPGPVQQSVLMLTPGFAVHSLDGPNSSRFELPPRVFDAYGNLSWMGRAGDRLSYNVTVMFGAYGDFRGGDGGPSPFRLRGFGVGTYKWDDRLKISFGAAYFDLGKYRVLPVAGVMITPNDDWLMDISFPYPKIATRVGRLPFDDDPMAGHWVYFGGQLGGGTWRVRMPSGDGDVLSYSDWRILLGIERKCRTRAQWQLETGYVFGRQIEFEEQPGKYEPSGTLMVRGLLNY